MPNHITEEQIQTYLDKQENHDVRSIEEHLKGCADCMKSLERYRQLYEELNKDPFPALSKDFSEQLVSIISGSRESRWRFFESGFTIAVFLFGIAAGLYFVNPLPFLTNVVKSIFENLGGYVTKFLPESNGYLPIFIVAILIFLLVEILDKKVIKSRL
jgi:hypothetical protein